MVRFRRRSLIGPGSALVGGPPGAGSGQPSMCAAGVAGQSSAWSQSSLQWWFWRSARSRNTLLGPSN